MAAYRVVAFLNLWLGLTAATQGSHLFRRAASSGTLPPSKDPWYTAPAGYEKAEPGTILRVRPAPGNLTSIIRNSSASYNILYRTTDSHYRPTWAVTTLLVPELGPNSSTQRHFQRSALLSYQVPYDSPDIDASPSYSLYSTRPDAPPPYDAALGLGLFVSVPDYEGPLASFTAGVISGHATLDSVRAVLSLDLGHNLGLNTTAPRVALWGYSGGALASEWASELAVRYAPDLAGNILGAALGGPTVNITSLWYSVNGGPTAGLIPNSILGLTSQYPDIRKHIVSQLNTNGRYNKTSFLAAERFTITESGVAYAGVDIAKFFQNGADIFRDPKLMALINREGIMGYHGVPQWPIFIYQAIHDEVAKITYTDTLVERYCAVGANILFQRNSIGTHFEEFNYSYEAAVQWLMALFTGQHDNTYKTKGCVIQNVMRNSTSSFIAKRGNAPSSVFNLW